MDYKIEKVPIYPGYIAVCVACNAKELYEVFDKESIDETGILRREFFCHTLYLSKDEYSHFTVVFNKNADSPITHGTITHESLHVLEMMCDNI